MQGYTGFYKAYSQQDGHTVNQRKQIVVLLICISKLHSIPVTSNKFKT